MTKLRYGLQLCNQVRIINEDPTNSLMDAVQVSHNKMLRMLDRISLKDHITSSSLLKKYNLPSVNQLAAQIKLIEAWKSLNIEHYPVRLEPNNPNRMETGRAIRASSIKFWKDDAKTLAAKMSFNRDAARLWNSAPEQIKNVSTLNGAKKEIKIYCNTFTL